MHCLWIYPNREPLYGEVADNHPVDSASVRLGETIPVNQNL